MDLDPALAPTHFIDSDHPVVLAFAREATAGAQTEREKASALFRAVRDRLRYDPYTVTGDPEDYRASTILTRDRAYCVPKAIALVAVARASGIAAWLGFSDVRNHLASEKLRAAMGTDLFVYHGYAALRVDGVVRKASPAFNAELCARFGVPPLEFDGSGDALLHAYDGQGRRHMEYLRDHGLYLELPLEEMLRAYALTYARTSASRGDDAAFE
ncbi:MAG: transglutaminase family protein [Polyangiaceae bacterium]|jgi:transglutaminase-like putative cysteine protease|nr:transglutaminase family protein [Polyangiaceae bacterium]